jgi:lipopolysaccharide transport system ATP-binding protein
MAIEFRGVESAPLRDFSAAAPDGAIIGIVGLRGSGKSALLRLAAAVDQPAQGVVNQGGAARRLLRPGDALDFSRVDVLALDDALAAEDPLAKARACVLLERLRRTGATVLLSSSDEPLLRRICDEIWWLREGRLAAKGDPRDVFPRFNAWVAEQFTGWGASDPQPMDAASRRGDGRAEILAIDTLDGSGAKTIVWRSGEPAAIRIALRFPQVVEHPVIGIMIRTRIGFEVYGTNTELEATPVGPCSAGDVRRITFRFCCSLCPGDYTVTAASHDPDGSPHDWLDDAVAVSVTDLRYTAGVANLRASIAVERAL